MVALFVVLTITALVLIDVLVVQPLGERLEAERKPAVFFTPELGLTTTDGGDVVKKGEGEKGREKKEGGADNVKGNAH